jgi:hypothetical protein
MSEKNKKNTAVPLAIGSVAGSQGAGLALGIKDLMGKKPLNNDSNFEKLKNHLNKKWNTDFKVKPIDYIMLSHANPSTNTAYAADNAAILGHEMGHLKNWNFLNKIKDPVKRVKITDTLLKAQRLGPYLVTLGAAGYLLNKNYKDEKINSNTPELVAGASFVPMLADEAGASIRSLKGLSEIAEKGQKTKEVIKGLKTLLPAFGSYAGLAGGAYFGVKAYKNLINNRLSKDKSMIKQAWKYDNNKKFINVVEPEEMWSVIARQSIMKKFFGLVPKKHRQTVIKEFLRSDDGYGLGVGGTIVKTKQGNKIFINKDLINAKTLKERNFLRNIIAHEAFHAKVPILGMSETFAHIYGGIKGPKQMNLLNRLKNGADTYLHLWKTRPDRAAIEAAILAGTGYGAAKGIKKLKEYFDKNKNE